MPAQTNTGTILLGFGLAVGAVCVGVWGAKGTRGLHAKGMHGSRTTRQPRQLRGATEVRELELYADNDGDLYRQQRQPIEKNLAKKMAKGVYDRSKAEKLWMYFVDNAAKKYVKEFGDERGLPWHKMFSMSDRREVARSFNDEWLTNHGHGA